MVSLEGEKRPLYGYIQDIDETIQSCIVYIDELCEKRSVPICCMRPLNVIAYEPKQHKGGKGDRKYNTFGVDAREYNSLNRSQHYSDFVFDSCQCRSDFCDAIYETKDSNRFTDITNFKPRHSNEIVAIPIQYTSTAQNMAANPNNMASNIVKNSKNRSPPGQNHSHMVVVQPAEKIQQVAIMKNENKSGNANNKSHHEQNPNDAPVNQQHSDQQLPSNVHGTRESSIEPAHQVPSNHYQYRGSTQYFYPTYEFGEQAPNDIVPNQQFFTVPPNAYPAAPVHGYAAHPNQMVAAINYVPMQYGQWPAYNAQGLRYFFSFRFFSLR